MAWYTPVERKLGVKLTPVGHHTNSEFAADKKINVDELIAAQAVEWQNPDARDCKLGDGLEYVYFDEFNVAIDPATNTVIIS